MGGLWGLLGPAVCCYLILRGAQGSADNSCPKSITCVLQRRESCPTRTSVCGPCLQGFEESSDGVCQAPKKGKAPITNIEAEIDELAAKRGMLQLQIAKDVNSTPTQAPPPPNAPQEVHSGRNRAQTEHPGAPNTVPRRGTKGPFNDALLLGVVVSCAVAGLMALIVAGICWCRLHKEMRLAEKADYASFKSSPPPPYEKASPGDKKLAQSAQMYHYQHQKQQMLSMEKNKDEPKHPDSAVTSDEENEDGDFTVYECPGLAPTGEMEVKNPLFDDSSLHHPVHSAP
ncbi:neural proliferation differentiation and control protein 1 [Discoglossus pictus]